jgi:predicted acyl esterase
MRVLWVVLLAAAVSGCLSNGPAKVAPTDDDLPRFGSVPFVPVRERSAVPFRTDGDFSYVLENGSLKILPALSVFVDVPVPLGNGLPTQKVHMGVFLPEVPEGTKMPVIADVGPYYGEGLLGDVHATRPANRLGRFLIENFVPHGYAVAQVSVLGTGDSEGCMDLMGEVEQAGIQAAVDWLGTQPWSNGNVALIGRSYDGSTPWEAAMKGSSHLKTIVPISGLYGQHDLMWRNGSAESRGPGVLWGLYFAFSYTGNEADPELQALQAAENTICPDTLAGLPEGLAAYGTADYVAPEANTYWTERKFDDEVLANYRGSVYFIHGLQDWNVDPHMAFPFYQQLEAKGLEMKGLFGQWGHMYPDRPGEHGTLPETEGQEAYPASVRWDWAEDLLEWFNYYLKGVGQKPELHVEVQDADGRWRIEDTYPPRDRNWTTLALGKELAPQADNADFIAQGYSMSFRSAPLQAPLRIAGLAQFRVVVTPTGPGGQIYAELRDVDQGGRRLGHAIMDLRLAAGGTDAQPVVPGMPLVARMEFEPFDVLVPAGHKLELFVSNTGRDYLPSAVSDPVLLDASSASVLLLPTIERGPEAFFEPPAWTPAKA